MKAEALEADASRMPCRAELGTVTVHEPLKQEQTDSV